MRKPNDRKADLLEAAVAVYMFDPAYRNKRRDMDIAVRAFVNGGHYADTHPAWVSFGQEKPNEMQLVLACTSGGEILIGQWNGEVFVNHRAIGETKGEVTHWMPLPNPPKKGGEQ